MGKSVIIVLIYIGISFWESCSGLPIDFASVGTGKLNAIWLTSSLLLAVGFLIGIVSLIIGCICCRNGRGFQQNEAKPVEEFSNSHGCLATPVVDGFVNPTASSEITIFPPFGVTSDVSSRSSIVNFEPLPNIKPPAPNLRPAAFSYSEQEISSQDWFYNPYNNFPRNQLKYLQEYGKGWFGRVVEGEAQNIVPNEKVTKVIVKILHEDATPTDQMYFLHEVKFYRDLKHPNILGLLGRCLETEPFLILLESCPNGDLKSFLTQNMASAQALVEQGVTLRMCYNITSGLQYMHENKFIHTDLAARNCLVSPDLTVKIGDYGNSIEVFKSDYYCAGSVALPVRWCAPETLKCTDVTIETREVTPLANIWTLAVVFWEICEFCKLPYEELNDDQVIVRVLGEKNYFLQAPKMSCLYKDELYHLMKLCWNAPLQRPNASQIGVILANLLSSKSGDKETIDARRLSLDFEQRWQKSKPNYIPKIDNATEVDDFSSSVTSGGIFKGAKVGDSSYMDSPLGVFLSNKSRQDSPRFRLKSDAVKSDKPNTAIHLSDSDTVENKSSGYETEEGYFNAVKKSDSVTNLTGSLDRLNTVAQELKGAEFKADFDLGGEVKPETVTGEPNPEIDSWLKGVEVNNEEDETFVRKISEAIRDLDAALAMEKTSSSEENSGKSSHQGSPGKETKENEDPVVVDFKLGGNTTSFINAIPKTFELSSLQNSEEPQSINFANPMMSDKNTPGFDSFEPNSFINPMLHDPKNPLKFKSMLFDESLKGNDSLLNIQSPNSSDTEDEIWRRRIERGEFSEKVKEKSKSIANLMVLTHIDASDDSDVDLDKPFDRNLTRGSYSRRHYSTQKSSLSSNNFGSENDLTNAVLEDTFKESLKKLSNDHKEYGHFDSLGMILPTAVDRQSFWGNLLRKSSSVENLISAMSSAPVESSLPTRVGDAKSLTGPSEMIGNNDSLDDKINGRENFLGNAASKKLGNDVSDTDSQNSASLDNKTNTLDSKIDNVNSASESIRNTGFNPNCDIGSECEKKVLNGSSPVYDSCEAKRVEGNEAREDLSMGISREASALIEPPSVEGNKPTSGFTEDTILEECGVAKEETSEIVPRFFGAENQSAALPKEELGEVAVPERTTPAGDPNAIPEITVTQEKEVQHMDDDDDDQMNVELEVAKIRPFKFVLKEEEKVENPSQGEDDAVDRFVEPVQLTEKISDNRELNFLEDKNVEEVSPLNLNMFSAKNENFETRGEMEVIIGACEDYTLDYFKGLKTTFGSEDEPATKETAAEVTLNKDVNLDIWDKHLEKSITQMLDSTNFDDINFFGSSLDSSGKDPCSDMQVNVSDNSISTSPNTSLSNAEGDEKEKKGEDPLHSSGFTTLNGNTSEEEYENNKLRTPDDERSSDSGFRDKGSLSESVEDACEGKYNLEDIEAELEEAYVKGAFSNCEVEKEKESNAGETGSRFEFEEAKFYEDENKNEDDCSDIDGEIEFWQNQEGTDYYPEISEFNPVSSHGWYLHPPDENFFVSNRDNVDEEFVNALRDELRKKLPVQSRSFPEFSEDYNPEYENVEDEKYMTDLSVPLSPILEEQDHSSANSEQIYFPPQQENAGLKGRKNVVSLMESGKTVDTNAFMQYLDYMVESEGKDKDIERVFSTNLMGFANEDRNEFERNDPHREDKSGDILVVDVQTNEAKLVGCSESTRRGRMNGEVERADILDEGSPSDEGLIFTPESVTPERDRSLSEPSRSSNGSRVSDAASDVTISSPDLLSECYLTPTSEKSPMESPEHADVNVATVEEQEQSAEDKSHTEKFLSAESSVVSHSGGNGGYDDVYVSRPEGPYEMSTSFMGELSDEDDGESAEQMGTKMAEEDEPEKSQGNEQDWDSFSSGGEEEEEEEEEASSSSGEFIWKDGEKESRVKVKHVSDNGGEESLFQDPKPEWAAKSEAPRQAEDDEEALGNGVEEVDENCNGYDDGNDDGNGDYTDSDDDRDCSSTGSSASITDFVPSAWNSKATPSRPALRSPDKKTESQKRSVWFKKQKYHCIYEYPREPSDAGSANSSPQKHFAYGMGDAESPSKYFTYGINSKNLSNPYFAYGLSDLIDYSNYVDWEGMEGGDPDAASEEGRTENGVKPTESDDRGFYNLNSFDYDFDGSGVTNDEFFVSSSARPFQGGSSQFYPRSNSNYPIFSSGGKTPATEENRDFVTPDSGLEDSSDSTPLNRPDDSDIPGTDAKNGDASSVLDNLKFTFVSRAGESGDVPGQTACPAGYGNLPPSPPAALGELRHTRDKLKLDLPVNHNIDLDKTLGKNVNKIEELTEN